MALLWTTDQRRNVLLLADEPREVSLSSATRGDCLSVRPLSFAPGWSAQSNSAAGRRSAIEQHRILAIGAQAVLRYPAVCGRALSPFSSREQVHGSPLLLVWSLGQLRSGKRDADCVLPHGDELRVAYHRLCSGPDQASPPVRLDVTQLWMRLRRLRWLDEVTM